MRARLVGAALTAAGLGIAAGAVRTRWAQVARVPAELRHPMAYLPLVVSGPLAALIRRLPARPAPLVEGVTVERRTVPGRGDQPAVDVLVYDTDRAAPTGALLWIHGGGFVIGDPVVFHDTCSHFAAELGVLVVSVDYRLAPQHPAPAAVEDCCTALAWLHEHAEELGVDPTRVAVAGPSAGGGLAACLAQLASDRGGPPVAFQLLVYPMLDDRTVLRRDHGGTGALVWTPASNRFGWTSYLGRPPREEDAPPYAAAARRSDLSGLPPAWIGVGDLDLFHEEDVAYARRLQAAGVPCELHVEPGLYHAADTLTLDRSGIARSFRDRMVEALRPVLTPHPAG